MSTQTAIRPIIVPPVKEFIGSFAISASVAIVGLDRRAAQAKNMSELAPVESIPPAAPTVWMHAPQLEQTSKVGKGGAFAIVVLVHALAIYALTLIAPRFQQETTAPLQVVTIQAPEVAKDTPPMSVPVLPIPIINVPLEPVIDVAVADSNSITVAPRPVEQAAAPTESVGSPKVVSSVEYLREPIAKYPSSARALKQRGTVMLRALIDTNGHAREVDVHRSSGFRLLDDTARNAVLNALFKPYTENGHSIPVYVFIPIEFGAAG